MKSKELKKGLKLHIHRETLRLLEKQELEQVAGGVSVTSCQCSANSNATCCSKFC